MKRLPDFLRTFFSLLLITGCLAGCGSDDSTDPPVLTQINISSTNGTRLDVLTQETTQLSVVGIDQFGNSIGIRESISWSSDNNNVSIDSEGLVTAVAVGASVITAETEGLETDYDILVWDSSAPRTDIFVSDVGANRNGPHQILRYDSEGNFGKVFIGSGLSKPQDIVFLEDQGIVLVSNLSGNNITKHDITTGESRGVFASGINGPTRIDIGPDNLLYVIQWNGGPVKRYDLDGNFIDDFTSSSINEAIGMAWDSGGNLYVSSFNNGSNGFVKKFDRSGNDQGFFINSNLAGPTDIWFKSGDLYVSDWSGNRVQKFDSDGAFISTFISNVSQPEGVDFFDNGDILIGASGSSSVKRYSSNGNFLEDLVSSGAASLKTTNAVVLRKVNQ